MLLPNLSDTAATSQDGSSLEFIAAITGMQCYIQDASGRGLWWGACTKKKCEPPAYLVCPKEKKQPTNRNFSESVWGGGLPPRKSVDLPLH